MTFRNLIVVALLLAGSFCFGQYNTPFGGDKKFFTGSGLKFNSAGGVTVLGVSPLIGYKVTPEFVAGFKGIYNYYWSKYSSYTASIYGGGPFVNYFFSNNIFATSQYEVLSFPPLNETRSKFSSFFVGLGYNRPISQQAAFQITALYNLLYADGSKSPYNSPIDFRVGIVTSF